MSASHHSPAQLQGFDRLRLALRLSATIDSSYPPFTHGQAILSTATGSRHHHFHLRHVAGSDRKVAPKLLTGMPGEHGIAAGGQDVRRQGADRILDRLTAYVRDTPLRVGHGIAA